MDKESVMEEVANKAVVELILWKDEFCDVGI
jgi:hypothetical protein